MIALAKPDNIIPVPQKSNEWYTPARYVEAAREVMGGIDLDPASCKEANMVVRAEKFYTAKDNGLGQPWYGNVWLNPPFGKSDPIRSGLGKWVQRALEEYQAGNVEQCTLLVLAQTDSQWFQSLWNYSLCFTNHAVRFWLGEKRQDKWHEGRTTNGHMWGTIFVYLGPHEQRFIDIFSAFGTIAKRVSTPKVQPVNLSLWEVQA